MAKNILRPRDGGFEKAALRYGLWTLSDSGIPGVMETLIHLVPNTLIFRKTLQAVLKGNTHAVVRIKGKEDQDGYF